MRRVVWFGTLAGVLLVTLVIGARRGHGPLTAQQRTDRIAERVKCPTCQGLSVADSKASASRAIYAVIGEQVRAGRSDDEVVAYLVDRYGEEELVVPEARGFSLMLWVAPVVVGAAAAAGVVGTLRRNRGRPTLAPSEADRARVASALQQYGRDRS